MSTTVFGSINDYQKGSIEIVSGDPKHYVFSNIFEVASKSSATVIPAQAFQGGTVWVVRDGKLERSDAVIGIKSVERVEVVGGLNPGELVLISPVGKMSAGQRVRTEMLDPRVAAALNRPADKGDSFKGFR